MRSMLLSQIGTSSFQWRLRLPAYSAQLPRPSCRMWQGGSPLLQENAGRPPGCANGRPLPSSEAMQLLFWQPQAWFGTRVHGGRKSHFTSPVIPQPASHADPTSVSRTTPTASIQPLVTQSAKSATGPLPPSLTTSKTTFPTSPETVNGVPTLLAWAAEVPSQAAVPARSQAVLAPAAAPRLPPTPAATAQPAPVADTLPARRAAPEAQPSSVWFYDQWHRGGAAAQCSCSMLRQVKR